MTDEKKLRGEEDHTITRSEIDAWHRGQKDALKSKLLKASTNVSTDQAIALIKLYAQLGDLHYLALKFNISVDEARRVLALFSVSSIEDARVLVNNGVIAEYDNAKRKDEERNSVAQKISTELASDRFEKHKEETSPQVKTPEEIDRVLRQRREDAQQKSKLDLLRKLITEGIDPKTGTSRFRVPMGRLSEFKSAIPHGVSYLQRRFGGSKADIVKEIQRLSPETNIDVLRP